VGARGTPEDTSPTRFGTVRPRVQIPGPRPILEFRAALVSRANVATPLYWWIAHVAHPRKRMTCMSEVMGLGLEVDRLP